MCATSGKTASVYDEGRKLNILMRLGVDDITRDEDEASPSYSFWLPLCRAELLWKSALITVDEESMKEQKLFKVGSVILEDLRHRRSEIEQVYEKPRFGGHPSDYVASTYSFWQ